VQGLPVNGEALPPGLADRGDARGSRNMHHVERRAGHAFGESQDAAEAEVLGQAIVDLGEILKADPAFADQLGIHGMTMSLSSAWMTPSPPDLAKT
jgi:hypothetical protein